MSANRQLDALVCAALEWLSAPGGDPAVREAIWAALRDEIEESHARSAPVVTWAAASRLRRRADAACGLVVAGEIDAALALSLTVWPPKELELAESEAA